MNIIFGCMLFATIHIPIHTFGLPENHLCLINFFSPKSTCSSQYYGCYNRFFSVCSIMPTWWFSVFNIGCSFRVLRTSFNLGKSFARFAFMERGRGNGGGRVQSVWMGDRLFECFVRFASINPRRMEKQKHCLLESSSFALLMFGHHLINQWRRGTSKGKLH